VDNVHEDAGTELLGADKSLLVEQMEAALEILVAVGKHLAAAVDTPVAAVVEPVPWVAFEDAVVAEDLLELVSALAAEPISPFDAPLLSATAPVQPKIRYLLGSE
jgi:hypothetical protein